MSTSKMAHADRERENTPVKQKQGKTWATKAQQDLPINVAKNSRLLSWKPEKNKFYNYVKSTLMVSPYF
jgi:hypothetical protein